MSTNLTEEIRSVEAAAAKTVSDAKTQAQDLVNSTRASAALRLKEAKQSQFRDFRARLAKIEAASSEESAKFVEKGKEDAKQFVADHVAVAAKTAEWLAEEVVSRYGRC